MTGNDNNDAFQKLESLLSSTAPLKWHSLQSIYVFHDGAMKLKAYYKENSGSEWVTFNTGSTGFEIMDWWQDYHRKIEETEGKGFKAAKAILDSSGNVTTKLSYVVIDPLADIDLLKATESI